MVEVGSIVRAPLAGRRVRGYVVQMVGDRGGRLKDISAVSGAMPVFDSKLLTGLQWAAIHYVAPLAVVLERCAPPNLPRGSGTLPSSHVGEVEATDVLGDLIQRAADGRRGPVTAAIGSWRPLSWVVSLSPILAAERSVLLIAATTAEVRETVLELTPFLGDRLVQVAGDTARELTSAWQEAQRPGKIIVGTPRAALWQVQNLALAVVFEEGRRAMKDRQTPTIHVRDLMTTRARSEGFGLVFFGPTPSLEILARGATVLRTPGRPWGLVEVVDRSGDPPGTGYLSDRVVAAMRAVVAEGRRCFVFTPWRGEEGDSVPQRIVREINQKLGSEAAAVYPSGLSIGVGTERDLVSLDPVGLAVAAESDGLLLGPSYRNSEEALRVLARLGDALEPGSGRRMMVQTSLPESTLMTALKRGDPVPYLEGLLVERARLGLPPATEMLALEIRGDAPADLDDQVRDTPVETEVLGPTVVEGGLRWLFTGELSSLRVYLRDRVQRWRDSGLTVRIDADPIDL